MSSAKSSSEYRQAILAMLVFTFGLGVFAISHKFISKSSEPSVLAFPGVNEKATVQTSPVGASIKSYSAFIYHKKTAVTDSNGVTTYVADPYIRQTYLNDLGNAIHFRTCHWNKASEAPENCNNWKIEKVIAPTTPGDDTFRQYTAFIFPRNQTTDGIREIYLNKSGTRIYFRTCGWDVNSDSAVNCSTQWTPQEISNFTGKGNPSYRNYYVYYFNNPSGGHLLRQMYVNEIGDKIYHRTCKWNILNQTAVSCPNVWLTQDITNITNPNSASIAKTVYGGYLFFLYSNDPNPGLWPNRIRQIFLSQNGDKVYYRSCNWDSNQGTALNCGLDKTFTSINSSDIVSGTGIN